MKIRLEKSLTDEERQRLVGWGEDIFGVQHLKLKWRNKDVHLLLDVDGRAVSRVGLLEHTITVGERAVKVCGVGGVVTALEEQGKGYASRAMREAARVMCEEWKVDCGLLFCLERLVPFYERLGWRRVLEAVEIEQPGGVIAPPSVVMILPCREGAWPAGRVQLKSLPW